MPPAAPASAPAYRFADHVRACCVDQDVVILDLREGRYLSVAGASGKAMAEVIIDWPGRPGAGPDGCGRAGVDGALQTLRSRRLLVAAGSAACAPPAPLPAPSSSIDSRAVVCGTRATLPGAWRFLLSVALAQHWLRRLTLERIAHRVRARRTTAADPFDPTVASRLVAPLAVFELLRPFAFTARDRCLFDSLALVDFLARHGLRAHWVVGVRTNPFRAHAWVQCGPVVLNDSHEHVRRFAPILVV